MIKYEFFNQKRFCAFKHRGVTFILDKAIQVGDKFMIIRENILWGKPGEYAKLLENNTRTALVECKSPFGGKMTYRPEANCQFMQNNHCFGGKVIGYTTESIDGKEFDATQIFVPYEFEGPDKDRLIKII